MTSVTYVHGCTLSSKSTVVGEHSDEKRVHLAAAATRNTFSKASEKHRSESGISFSSLKYIGGRTRTGPPKVPNL